MKVCVVGAGIVGCTTAYQLARDGHEVRLVDAGCEPGRLTSFANGGQLSYSYVEPFASPATLRSLPSLLLSAASPVRLRLKADRRQWGWLLRFLRACGGDAARRGTAALLELARLSRLTLHDWMRTEQWDVSFVQNGKLVLCPDAATLRKQEAQVKFQALLGSRQEVLTPLECLQREPALSVMVAAMAGGVWTADECVADPYLLCRELVRSFERLGGHSVFDTKVHSFVQEGQRFVAARSSAGDFRADAFVLAAGPAAADLARGFGIGLPIYPIKGYSITVPFKTGMRPRASVTDLGRKTVFAPLGDRLRVAAMAEIVGYDMRIPSATVCSMIDSVDALYPDLCDLREPQRWAGLRPATPTSVPIIGRVRRTNMFINAGHGALGLTLAAGSAVRLSDLVAQSRAD